MSKYTTEVRFICEQKSGLLESQDGNTVDDVLENSWNKIFDNSWDIFDENYRKGLCKKILKHYYTREIGAETVGLWRLWLNQKMSEIMPYYNKMYESELLKFEPLKDTDIVTVSNRKIDSTAANTIKNNNTNTYNETTRDLYSDTPQGALTGVENEEYLTNARKNIANSTNTDNGTSTSNGKGNSNDEFKETVSGKRGSQLYSQMLIEYRRTFLNIDMMVIEELGELFLNLW